MTAATNAIGQVVREVDGESHDEATHATVAGLLAGALTQRALAGEALDEGFLRRCVEAVLEGAG